MDTIITAVVVAAIGSAGLFTFLQFLISRKDKNARDIADIKNTLSQVVLDNCRLQMLTMMNNYPNQSAKVLGLAERYFVELGGDWYMTDLFLSWLKEQDIEIPAWFRGKE